MVSYFLCGNIIVLCHLGDTHPWNVYPFVIIDFVLCIGSVLMRVLAELSAPHNLLGRVGGATFNLDPSSLSFPRHPENYFQTNVVEIFGIDIEERAVLVNLVVDAVGPEQRKVVTSPSSVVSLLNMRARTLIPNCL